MDILLTYHPTLPLSGPLHDSIMANLLKLPQTVWNGIVTYLSIIDTSNTSLFGNFLTKKQQHAKNVWGAIFKSDKWLNLATRQLKVHPFLFGRDLDLLPAHKPELVHLGLATTDKDGELRWYPKIFFESLQDGWKYVARSEEVIFDSGIILNVHNILVNAEAISCIPGQLLQRRPSKTLKAYYCFYEDQACELKAITESDMTGAFGPKTHQPLLRVHDKDFFCVFDVSFANWRHEVALKMKPVTKR